MKAQRKHSEMPPFDEPTDDIESLLDPPAKPKNRTQSLLDSMRGAIASQESGANYNVRPNTRTGALGKYQVLPGNVPAWTKKHLGRQMSPQEFARDPDAQDRVFNAEMGSYLDKAQQLNPNADDDTVMRMGAAGWYAGPGKMDRHNDRRRFRKNEPSIGEYADIMLKGIRKAKPPVLTPTDDIAGLLDDNAPASEGGPIPLSPSAIQHYQRTGQQALLDQYNAKNGQPDDDIESLLDAPQQPATAPQTQPVVAPTQGENAPFSATGGVPRVPFANLAATLLQGQGDMPDVAGPQDLANLTNQVRKDLAKDEQRKREIQRRRQIAAQQRQAQRAAQIRAQRQQLPGPGQGIDAALASVRQSEAPSLLGQPTPMQNIADTAVRNPANRMPPLGRPMRQRAANPTPGFPAPAIQGIAESAQVNPANELTPEDIRREQIRDQIRTEGGTYGTSKAASLIGPAQKGRGIEAEIDRRIAEQDRLAYRNEQIRKTYTEQDKQEIDNMADTIMGRRNLGRAGTESANELTKEIIDAAAGALKIVRLMPTSETNAKIEADLENYLNRQGLSIEDALARAEESKPKTTEEKGLKVLTGLGFTLPTVGALTAIAGPEVAFGAPAFLGSVGRGEGYAKATITGAKQAATGALFRGTGGMPLGPRVAGTALGTAGLDIVAGDKPDPRTILMNTAFAALGGGRIPSLTETVLKQRGYEPYTVRSESGKTATVYAKTTENGAVTLARPIGEGKAVAGRPEQVIPDEIFNRIVPERGVRRTEGRKVAPLERQIAAPEQPVKPVTPTAAPVAETQPQPTPAPETVSPAKPPTPPVTEPTLNKGSTVKVGARTATVLDVAGENVFVKDSSGREMTVPKDRVRAVEKAKEPWEMTRDEWEQKHQRTRGGSPDLQGASPMERGRPVPLTEAEARTETRKMAGGRTAFHSDGTVTIHRGVNAEVNDLAPGDFVTLDAAEAQQYANKQGGKVITLRVPQADVAWVFDAKGPHPLRYAPNGALSVRMAHRLAIERALAEGKPVPPEVLADYPDLQPKDRVTPVAEQPVEQPAPPKPKRQRVARGLVEEPDEAAVSDAVEIQHDKSKPPIVVRDLTEALKRYDDTDSIGIDDLANIAEGLIDRGKAPASLQDVVDKYRAATTEDIQQYGGRSGLGNEAAEALERALRNAIKKNARPTGPKRGHEKTLAEYLKSAVGPENQSRKMHRANVEYALRNGETVAPEVLKDYPDLAKSAPTPAPVAAPAAKEAVDLPVATTIDELVQHRKGTSDYGIYALAGKDGTRYAIKDPRNSEKGFGDTLENSLEAAQQRAAMEKAQAGDRAAREERAAAEQAVVAQKEAEVAARRAKTEGETYRIQVPSTPLANGRLQKELDKPYRSSTGKIRSIRDRLDAGDFVGKEASTGGNYNRRHAFGLDNEGQRAYEARLAKQTEYFLTQSDGTQTKVPKLVYDAVEFKTTTPKTESVPAALPHGVDGIIAKLRDVPADSRAREARSMVQQFAGDRQSDMRQQIYSALMGRNVPKSQSGVNAIAQELVKRASSEAAKAKLSTLAPAGEPTLAPKGKAAPVTRTRAAQAAKSPTLAPATVAAKAKGEKVNARTGLTPTQTAFVADKLEGIADQAMRASNMEGGLQGWRDNPKTFPFPTSWGQNTLPEPVTIKVPGDGEFKVGSLYAANNLHQKITGKPIEGLERSKSGTTIGPIRGERTPSTAAQTTALDLYGHPVEAIEALTAQRPQLKQAFDEATDPKEKEAAKKRLAEFDQEIKVHERNQHKPGFLSKNEPLTPFGKSKRAEQVKREAALVKADAEAEVKAETKEAAMKEAGDYRPTAKDIADAIERIKNLSPAKKADAISSARSGTDRGRAEVRKIIKRELMGRPKPTFGGDIGHETTMLRQYAATVIAGDRNMRKWFEEGTTPDVGALEQAAQKIDKEKGWLKAKPAYGVLESARYYTQIMGIPAAKPAPASRTRQAQAAKPRAAAKAEPEKLVDVGEKIGGARKDLAVSTGPKRPKLVQQEDTNKPAWAKRWSVHEIVAGNDEGRWSVSDSKSKDWMGRPHRLPTTFESKEAAEAAIPLAAVSLKHSVHSDREGKFAIYRKIGDRKIVQVVEQKFDSREDAMKYMAQHPVEILDVKTSFGEEILPKPETVVRKGIERRTADAKPEDFTRDFGFRAVEFGNWNNQTERQEVVNHAYDALQDMAELLGIPPEAIGLNGELALAFGARGQGLSGARAHYERSYGVMNLTKMQGAGALAHEWFHSLDHYFGRQSGKASRERVANDKGDKVFKAAAAPSSDYVTHGFPRQNLSRPEIKAAYDDLVQTMLRKGEKYKEDSAKVEKFLGNTRNDLEKIFKNARDGEYGGLSKQQKYGAKKAPASAEQLAEFDAITQKILDGEFLELKPVAVGDRRSGSVRWTNDALEKLSKIYKDVRGRTGFSQQGGWISEDLGPALRRHSARLKMLAEAQSGAEKTRMVPTSYAMEAKSLDQGRTGEYWLTPHEMAARAFQAYVEDKLGEVGAQNDFLSYGSHFVQPTPWGWARPFPHGEEREAINKAFDKLFEVMESRKTDKGTELYKKSDFDDATQAELDRVNDLSAAALRKEATVTRDAAQVYLNPAAFEAVARVREDMAGAKLGETSPEQAFHGITLSPADSTKHATALRDFGFKDLAQAIDDAKNEAGHAELILSPDAVAHEDFHGSVLASTGYKDASESLSPEDFTQLARMPAVKAWRKQYAFDPEYRESPDWLAVHETAATLAQSENELELSPQEQDAFLTKFAQAFVRRNGVAGIEKRFQRQEKNVREIIQNAAKAYEAESRIAVDNRSSGSARTSGETSSATGSSSRNNGPPAETGKSKIGKSIEAKAVEKGLADSFAETAEYTPIKVKDQAAKIAELMNSDPELIKDIIAGDADVPRGISGTYLIKAVEDAAMAAGDVDTLQALAKSPLVSETSVHAQELRMAAERSQDSAVEAIKAVAKARRAKQEQRHGGKAKVNQKVKEEKEKIKKEVKAKTTRIRDWESFIRSIAC